MFCYKKTRFTINVFNKMLSVIRMSSKHMECINSMAIPFNWYILPNLTHNSEIPNVRTCLGNAQILNISSFSWTKEICWLRSIHHLTLIEWNEISMRLQSKNCRLHCDYIISYTCRPLNRQNLHSISYSWTICIKTS